MKLEDSMIQEVNKIKAYYKAKICRIILFTALGCIVLIAAAIAVCRQILETP